MVILHLMILNLLIHFFRRKMCPQMSRAVRQNFVIKQTCLSINTRIRDRVKLVAITLLCSLLVLLLLLMIQAGCLIHGPNKKRKHQHLISEGRARASVGCTSIHIVSVSWYERILITNLIFAVFAIKMQFKYRLKGPTLRTKYCIDNNIEKQSVPDKRLLQ